MDKETFTKAYAAQLRFVWNVCLTLLRNPADTEDAVQETFLRLLHQEEPENIRAWLLVTARNVCRDELRRFRRQELPLEDAGEAAAVMPEIDERLQVIPVGEGVTISGMKIRAFHTPHDTDESVGYRVECGGGFALATGMGCVTEEVRQNLLGADAVLIEANHDEEMLRYGRYPVFLKRRILSEHGHLSNANCAELARELAMNGTGTIILGHLSRENNTPDAALDAVGEAVAGTGALLLCAPASGFLELEV